MGETTKLVSEGVVDNFLGGFSVINIAVSCIVPL